MNMTSADDWIEWALLVEIPGRSEAIGQSGVRLVLVALSLHAGKEGRAFPSSQTLADEIRGMHRRDVRNALAVLETGGVISRDGKAGRSVRWRLNVPDEAGYPATSTEPDAAGYPATSTSADVAGNVAGEVAGNLAGYPAANLTELKNPPTPQPERPVRRAAAEQRDGEGNLRKKIDQLAQRHGITADEAQRFVSYARADPETTDWEARTLARGYLAQFRDGEKGRRAAELHRAPKCPDHPENPASNCGGCNSEIRSDPQIRDGRYRGRHQPQCQRCHEPILGVPEGADYCRNCAGRATA